MDQGTLSNKPSLRLLAAVLLSLAGVVSGLLLSLNGATAVGIPLAVVGVVVFLLGLPIEALPAVALVSYAALPNWMFGSLYLLGALGPAPFVLLLWALRGAWASLQRGRAGRPALEGEWRRSTTWLAVALLVWIVLSRLFGPYGSKPSDPYGPTAWVVSIGLSVIVPLICGSTPRTRRILLRTWLVLGGIEGALAVAEQLTKSPIFYSRFYASHGLNSLQHWSVYRSEGGFGHPLYAGVFLCVAVALSIGAWLESGKWINLILGLLSAAGLVATVSRGSMLAAAAAVAVAGLVVARRRVRGPRTRLAVFALIGVIAVFIVLNLGFISERSDSAEASDSSGERTRVIQLAYQLWHATGFWGSGPGTSSLFAHDFSNLVLENSWLQLLVSIGLVGLLMFGVLVAELIRSAVRYGDTAVLGGIVAYCVSIAAFNAIDDVPSMHVLLGALILMCPGRRRADPTPLPDTRTPRQGLLEAELVKAPMPDLRRTTALPPA